MSSPHMHILLLLMFAAVSRGIPSAESGGLQLNHSLSGIPGPSSGPNPSVIGSHDTQKAPLGVSWLRFDLVDPFTNASALLDIFMPHKLIATFTVLFFILLSAVIWYVLDKLDSRRPVVDQLSKLHRCALPPRLFLASSSPLHMRAHICTHTRARTGCTSSSLAG